MSIQDKAVLSAAVDAAFAAQDHLLEDGTRDAVKVREIIVETLRTRKVLNKKERAAKAVTRGAMVEAVFPGLPGPDSFADTNEPDMAQAVWSEVDKYLWSMTNASYSSAVQHLVGQVMGNGYVLCRTKVGRDATWASYITDDVTCIREDFIAPINISLDRATTRALHGHELLIQRRPDIAAQVAAGLNKKLKSLQTITATNLQLALEAAMPQPEDGDEADEDSDE